MSRREDFARLVDGDTTGSGGSVAGLADIAAALRELGRTIALPAPDPQFRVDLRQRLVAVATVQGVEPAVAGAVPPARVAGRRPPRASGRAVPRGRRGLVALAGGVAVIMSVAGVSVAASRSLPGSPFYDVKRAAESVQLFTARGQLDKGRRHLEFAATRLDEARALPVASSHLPSTLDAMDSQTRDGASDLIAVARSSHSAAPLSELRTFTHSQYADLRLLIAASPPALRAREVSSANLLAGIDQQAAQLAATGAGPVIAPGSGPGSGGLDGLLQGALPTPGPGDGSAPAQPGPGGGILPPHPLGGRSAGPVPTASGLPLPLPAPVPVPSLPIKVPTTLPSTLPTLPTTLPSTLPTLPTTLPTILPTTLPTLLPSVLPSVLPTIKLGPTR